MKNKIKIVIADDNPNIRHTLADILTSKGYLVDTVSDGYELIDYLKENSSDILILDLIMPNKDGIEILSTVKNISSDTKIIIYTAFQRYEHSVYANKVDKFLLKTDKPEKLLQAIEKLT